VASAFRSIREMKLRSFLTCLGIIIGVATVIVMVSLVNGFNNQFIAQFQQFGATLVQFQLREQQFGGPPREDDRILPPLTLADAEAIRRYAWAIGVVSPERWKYQGVDLRFQGKRMEGPVVGGVQATYPEANSHFVGQGRFFTPAEDRHSAAVAIVGKSVVEALMPRLDPLQRRITDPGPALHHHRRLREEGRVPGGQRGRQPGRGSHGSVRRHLAGDRPARGSGHRHHPQEEGVDQPRHRAGDPDPAESAGGCASISPTTSPSAPPTA
jgi:hypothetical protein